MQKQNNVYSVSQVNKYVKNMFLNDYLLQSLSIRGEISNLKYHSSGHIYFSLKDESGSIRCVMFAGNRPKGLTFRLAEGMQVVVTGSCDVYERDGSYQIYARVIKEDGIGNLFEEFEKLKRKLEEQGMFDPSYKRPIPKFVKTLGVVTAPTGAAVRDIIDVSKRRNPGVQILLFPALVQGDGAPESIVKGIKALEKQGVDLIIVGRGGGSMEDLWGFNDERVAEAIFNSSVPIISAVGHETDFTIADFVSDLRAPTPSAAAELANPDMRDRVRQLSEMKLRLSRSMNQKLYLKRAELNGLKQKLEKSNPKNKLKESKLRLMMLAERLEADMKGCLSDNKHRLELMAGRLNGLSPLAKLEGGYSYVSGNEGAVKSIDDVQVSDSLKIHVTDGIIKASVTGKEGVKWQK